MTGVDALDRREAAEPAESEPISSMSACEKAVMPKMFLRLLGEPALSVGEVDRPIRGRGAQAVLFMIVTEAGISRDRLAALVWSLASDHEAARLSLRGVLHAIRLTCGDILDSRDGWLRLRNHIEHDLHGIWDGSVSVDQARRAGSARVLGGHSFSHFPNFARRLELWQAAFDAECVRVLRAAAAEAVVGGDHAGAEALLCRAALLALGHGSLHDEIALICRRSP